MPLILPVGETQRFYIFGTKPFLGAPLGTGQTISLLSGDGSTVLLLPDPSPLPVRAADASGAMPAKTPTMLSGIVSSPSAPAQPNLAITCTARVINADGSTAESLADTVTISTTAELASGELFGAGAVVTTSSTTAKGPVPAEPKKK